MNSDSSLQADKITKKSIIMFLKSQEQLIFEIHHEFDTASQSLLDFAYKTRQQIKEDTKADRLKKLGFTKLNRVIVNDDNKKILDEIKASVDLIEHYQNYYPFQKFVTEEQLDKICKKYGLIYAPVNRYLKDVPEKNLMEIENAPALRSTDYPLNKYYIRYTGEFINGTKRTQKKRYRKGIIVSTGLFDSIDSGSRADRAFTKETGLDRARYSGDWKIEQIKLDGLFIAAPKSHFDLKGLKHTNKVGFRLFTPVIQKDPIVFRYVKGGIQVLSKWGLEANDEELANPIEN